MGAFKHELYKDEVVAGTFRKLPVEITAVKVTERRVIKTLEGDMTAEVGDWLITGVKGEVYPCKPDIFEQTYELVKGIINVPGSNDPTPKLG